MFGVKRGHWRLVQRGDEGGLGRKDVPAPPPFSTSGFIFLRFAATLSLSSSELPPGRLKRKCESAETLTSLFWNALISVDRLALETEEKPKDIEGKRPTGNVATVVRKYRRNMYVLSKFRNNRNSLLRRNKNN